MTMKRFDTLKDILAAVGLLTIVVLLGAKITINSPSDTQQILRQIQEVQTSIERQISELPLSVNCNK